MTAQANIDDYSVRGTGGLEKSLPVPRLFWPAAAFALWFTTAGPPFSSGLVNTGALLLMLIGGLPHGAYDIAIACRTLRLDRNKAGLLLIAYISIALAMAALWALSPAVALAVFLFSAALHFGEDWKMLDTGLLRATAGASVICIPAIFQQAEVSALFVLMAGPGGELVARIAVACAPVAIMVMLTALIRAFMQGDRHWVAAQATAFAGLAALTPGLGFVLFFVFLHSPLHMQEVRRDLSDWPRARLGGYGLAICAIALAGGIVLSRELLSDTPALALAGGFKVLSILAAPHLILHLFMDRTATLASIDPQG
jgi:Brp/Blh family beta-carotene 15,15'-monooxygenase